MKKFVIVSLVSLFATSAMAQGNTTTMTATGTEEASLFYFAPAPAGHNVEFRPGLLPRSIKLDVKTNGTKTSESEFTDSTHNLLYQYSISEAATLGLSTFIGSTKVKTTPNGGGSSESKNSGMGDLTFKYSGWSALDSSSKLRWGADLGFSPGKSKAATVTADGNLYSGGMSLTPSVAWESTGSVLSWGVGGFYELNMERTEEAAAGTTDDTKTTGGNTLTLKPYLEVPFTNGRAGGFLKYMTVGETKSKTGTAPESTATKAATAMALGGAVAYGFTESIAGLAELEYTSISSDDTPGSGLALTIGGRATF